MNTGQIAICFVVIGVMLTPVRLFAIQPGATPSPASDEAVLAEWIGSLQFQNPSLPSFGAIQVDRGPGYRAPNGEAYYRVSPYDANLAVAGLLHCKAPDCSQIADRWISWYLSHIGQNGSGPGLIYDYWYLKDGGGETAAPPGIGADRQYYIDASDSAAATFLRCVWADAQAGGRSSLLKMPDLKSRLEGIAKAILSLQQPDGLTWAKSSYRVEYTMDNSEVFLGLRCMALMENTLFKDRLASARYESSAERVRSAIVHTLYDPKKHLFSVARFDDGKTDPAKLTGWYPDMAAQVWPALFGVIGASDPMTWSAFGALDNAWNGKTSPNWTDSQVDPGGFLWPSIAHAALVGGDTSRGKARALYVRDRVFPKGPGDSGFSPPFSVSDAGWLIAALAWLEIHH